MFNNQDEWQFVGGLCLLNCTVISSNRAESSQACVCHRSMALSLLWTFFSRRRKR